MVDLAGNTADDAAPPASDDEFDAAMNAARERMSQQAGLEAEEDVESGEVPLSDDEPEGEEDERENQDNDGDDLDDFLKSLENDDTSLESNEVPEESEEGSEEGDVELSKLSRKQRGKIIERLRKEQEELKAQLLAEQEEKQRLEAAEEQRKADDKKLEADIARALGTDEEYDKTIAEVLENPYASDEVKEKARIWRNNRLFYGKLVGKAQRDVKDKFAAVWFQTVESLPGVDKNAVSGSLVDSMQHLYAAGYVQGESKKQKEVEVLQKKVDALEQRMKAGQRKVAVTTARTPVSGGNTVATPKKEKGLFDVLFDEDGMPTDASEEAIRSGRLQLGEITRRQR